MVCPVGTPIACRRPQPSTMGCVAGCIEGLGEKSDEKLPIDAVAGRAPPLASAYASNAPYSERMLLEQTVLRLCSRTRAATGSSTPMPTRMSAAMLTKSESRNLEKPPRWIRIDSVRAASQRSMRAMVASTSESSADSMG